MTLLVHLILAHKKTFSRKIKYYTQEGKITLANIPYQSHRTSLKGTYVSS